jgi:hypothetical protein
MKNLPLLAALLLLTGCKFVAPLTDKPTRPVQPELLGQWFSLADGKSLNVFRLSSDEYLAVDDGVPYVCTHSDLAGVPFVSCRQIQNDKEVYGKYAYVAWRLDHDELVLTLLNDSLKLNEKQSAAEIRAVVERAAKAGTALDPDPMHEKRYKRVAPSQ